MTAHFEAKALDTDAIGVRWDGAALSRGGVQRIRLVAQPMDKSLHSLESEVDASAGEATISDNVMPSSTYAIHVEDAEKSGFKYCMGEVKTKPPGELSPFPDISMSTESTAQVINYITRHNYKC